MKCRVCGIVQQTDGGDKVIDFRILPFHNDDLEELEQLKIDFVFQPIFDAKTLEISAYEALMRPKGMSPLELIDEYQKKDKLHVIEIASCFGSTIEYEKRGYKHAICINSLPSESLNEGQMKLYFDCFPDMEGRIIVEIVEYTELNKHRWGAKKEEISYRDMRIALDDYSTGNNDMEAVDFFNPHYVKLDRTLISGINSDAEKQNRAFVLVKELHDKGIKVVAEGVETLDELEYLRHDVGVDYVQGYYLAKPA